MSNSREESLSLLQPQQSAESQAERQRPSKRDTSSLSYGSAFVAASSMKLTQSTVATPAAVEFDSEDQLTDQQCLQHLLKATIGTGVLAIPGAVSNAGLLIGPTALCAIALVTLHCMRLLVGCAQRLRSTVGEVRLDYEAVAELAFVHGHWRLRGLAGTSRFMLNVFLMCNQFGLVAVYYLFVCENVQQFLSEISGNPLSLALVAAAALLIFLPYVFVRNLRLLAPLATVANACVAIALVGIVIYCCSDLKPVSSLPLTKPIATLPLFFGVVLFSFESINLVLPIENKLIDRTAMTRCCGLLDTSVFVVIAMYTAIGFFGYLRFGDEVRESITYSLPNDLWYMAIVKLVYSFSIFVSYGLQYYLLALILCQWLLPSMQCQRRTKTIVETLVRTGIVLFSFAVPLLIPHLDLIISLIGGFSGSAIIFIYPPLLSSVLHWDDYNRDQGRFCFTLVMMKNSLLILFGIAALSVATFASLSEMIAAF